MPGDVSLQRRGHRAGHREQEERLDREPAAPQFAIGGRGEWAAEEGITSTVRAQNEESV